MKDLLALRCQPQSSQNPLSEADILPLLAKLDGWSVTTGTLSKIFRFSSYYGTMAFVNAVAWVAHREDHHPDLSVHYNHVVVKWSTHDAGGLTLNDFICAANVEALLSPPA